jgi:hypothetical protein
LESENHLLMRKARSSVDDGEYREVYRNRYLRGILIQPFMTGASYTLGAFMSIVVGCLFIWLVVGLLGKEAGSMADFWALAQRSPGKALGLTTFALLLSVIGIASVPLGLGMVIYAWWSFALVVISRFCILSGSPLAKAEGPPTFYSRRLWKKNTPWIREYIVHHVEIGGLEFRLDDLVTSKLPEGREALSINYWGWTRILSESYSSMMKRVDLPFRAWYVPSTRILVRIDSPVWPELLKLESYNNNDDSSGWP